MIIPGALCDTGSGINLMPANLFRMFGIQTLAPIQPNLVFADGSSKSALGVAENLMVKVGDFTFPADFVVLDMKYDVKIPIILGRPFFKTARALFDFAEGCLVLRHNEDKISFQIGRRPRDDIEVTYADTLVPVIS